jgi:hypothetical protein
MNDYLERCEETARTQGLSAGLAVALAEVDLARTAAGRVVGVPEELASAGQLVVSVEPVVFIRIPSRGSEADPVPPALPAALARVRIGVSSAALAAAAEFLSARSSAGEPLVRKQLVVGTIADAVVELDLVRYEATVLAHVPDTGVAADVHTRIDRLDWEVAKLFGAGGYLTGHRAHGLYVSSLVANSWLDRTESSTWT